MRFPSYHDLHMSYPSLSTRTTECSIIKSYYCHESKDSVTALHILSKRGNLDVIKKIVAYQPGLVSKRIVTRGDTPLMYAVASQNVQVIRYLVHLCPEAVTMRSFGNGAYGDQITPLHLAISMNARSEIIQILVKANQKVLRSKSGNGETPYQLAQQVYFATERSEVIAAL